MAVLSTIFLILFGQFYSTTITCCHAAEKSLSSKFPAILIFGDSTVDTGNNNYIKTAFRGNHRPYGLDFPGQVPTGRFSNGKLVPDFVASMIGLKESVPPFLQPGLSDEELLTGVSFASAGSGYDELTTIASGVIPVSKQTELLQKYINRVVKIVGEKKAQKLIEGALVIISAGTNDFVFNYYDLPTRRFQFSIDKYQDFLLTKMENFVKELYRLGCRKIIVAGLPPIGCLPIQLSVKVSILRKCIGKQNSDAKSYNEKLINLVQEITDKLSGSKILYADIYTYFIDMINNPSKYGFLETRRGCCGTGLLEAGPFCNEFSPVCPNPSGFLFFDSIHPGEASYRFFSDQLVKIVIPILSQEEENNNCTSLCSPS